MIAGLGITPADDQALTGSLIADDQWVDGCLLAW
jgi:hypothetical protein